MKIYKVLTVVFFMAFSCLSMSNKAYSQIIEVGVTGGLSYYIGDINPKKHFAQSNLALGGMIRYYENLRWAFRLQYSNLSLAASDEKIGFRPERGLAFQSKVNDVSLIAEFNFFDYWTGGRRSSISPYIFGGLSMFHFSTYAPDGRDLQLLQTEGVSYSNISWSIPFGIGMKYSITKHLGVTIEWRMHKAFTDYIDDIHGSYPKNDVIVDGHNYTDPTGLFQEGMQRGNGSSTSFGFNNDWYGTLGVTLLYKFVLPSKEPCYSGL